MESGDRVAPGQHERDAEPIVGPIRCALMTRSGGMPDGDN